MQQIAHYRILEQIGEGAMGQVFLAEDTRLERRVALKVLSNPSPDDDQVKRFEREAKAVAALDHPNVLSIHDFGREGNRPYVVMEFLTGQTLRERLDSGPIPVRKAIGFAIETASGLAAAHEKGIWHRDLKPANIFITADGRVKILDFGLAMVRRSAETVVSDSSPTVLADAATNPGTVLGTVGYMAPEQVRGLVADQRSDLFALGCVMFELFSGQRAFHEQTPIETMHAILKEEARLELLEKVPVPATIVQIVRRCLEKEPAQRFQSARDLEFALQAVLAMPPFTQAHGTHGVTIIRDAEAALAATLSSRRSIAVLPFTNMSGDADTEYFSDGVTEDIINALAQLAALRVAARTSSFAFKGKQVDLAEVGSKLKVDCVLEGSVRRSGKRLRVTAQLINVSDGYHLWSDRYDRELDDVFAIQDDIATNISRKLRLTFEGKTEEPLVRPSTEHMGAYDLYLQGRYLLEQRGEGIGKGLQLFHKAIALDPKFALAHASVAETLCLLSAYNIGSSAQRMVPAQAAATRALELDPSLAEAHNAMALVHMLWTQDWAAGEAEFNRAIDINPNYVNARYWKGLLYHLFVKRQGREALDETLHAVDLDPMGTVPAYALGLVLVCLGHNDEAIKRARDAMVRDPNSVLLRRIIGSALMGRGEFDEAVSELEQAVAFSGREAWLLSELGAAYIGAGKADQANRLQDEMLASSETTFVSGLVLSVIPLLAGRVDEAMAHIQRSFDERQSLFIGISSWPVMARAREDPRVRRMCEQIGVNLES
jgi:serine/threonine protein kinase/tetratricopeptide (TPR) repeat protein